jgi:hypothetical protein
VLRLVVAQAVQHRDWIDYATLVAVCFAATGTVAAVCVALWQSMRQSRPRARVWTKIVSRGARSDHVSQYELTVRVNNSGVIPFTVEDVDVFDKSGRQTIFADGYPASHHLPQLVTPGQSVAIVFQFSESILFGEMAPKTIVVTESAGHTFRCHYDPWLNDWARMPRRYRAVGRVQAWRHPDEK